MQLEIPEGYFGLVSPCVHLSLRQVLVIMGVIDCDYRGEVFVLLTNISGVDMHIRVGDCVGQLLIQKVNGEFILHVL